MEQPVVLTAEIGDPWAALVADASTRNRETHVMLRLGQDRYAASLDAVEEVLPVPHMTRLPGGPLWLAGIVNWRGKVLPAIDLRPLMGNEQIPLPSSARLLVLVEGDVQAGLIAEAVPGLLPDPGEAIDVVPATVTPIAASILSGMVSTEGGRVALIDVPAVLALRGQLSQARPSW